ncbi:MAG TPA: hypothetical protein VN045_13820 [Microbacteriaceae bacterium]|nr:hypothetical protein [Microbacteriaceae bacterium]
MTQSDIGLRRGPLLAMRILSAIVLFAIGGIHLFLVFDGVGGLLGVLFILNAIAGIVLGIGMLALRGRLFTLVSVLGLLFAIASLVALLLALSVGLFGITETWTFTLVPQTVVVDAIGVVLLGITLIALLRRGRAV